MGRSPGCDDSSLKKGPWTPEEDEKLINHIQQHGHGSWRALPKLAGLNRCGKSCRLRWTNYLRPDIKRGKFSQDEEQSILHLHSILGNKWSAIATHLPGRTDNEIKNFWNTHLKKKLIQMGFDPMTHRPRTDIFSSLPHLIALASLKDLMEHHSWEEQAARFQSEAVQMARLQYLQNLLQPQLSYTTPTSSLSNLNTSPIDLDTYNLLNSLSSMTTTEFGTQTPSSSSLDNINGIQSIHDSIIPFSHMPELQIPCSFQTSMNNDMVQPNSDYSVISKGESLSPSLSLPVVAAPPSNDVLVENNIGDGGSTYGYEVGPSSFWNEVLLEESLFHDIA